MNFKYNIGDKVKIIDCSGNPTLEKFSNCNAIITEKDFDDDKPIYQINIDCQYYNYFWWSEKMFQDIREERRNKLKKIGKG
jgi:hypothetical protein